MIHRTRQAVRALALPAAVLLAAATTAAASPTATATATATLATADGTAAGTATFTQVHAGLQVKIDAAGLPPGEHGLHIHTAGRCDPPGFDSAGGHWNPTTKKHGKLAPDGMHEGDLPNLTIAADGTGHAGAMIKGATLTGGKMPLLDADGAAIVVHASADDYKTDPSGNSGARIACGVITAG